MLCVEVTRDVHNVPVHHTHVHNIFSNCTAHKVFAVKYM